MIASTTGRTVLALAAALFWVTGCPTGPLIQVVEPGFDGSVDAAVGHDGAVIGDAAGQDQATASDSNGGQDQTTASDSNTGRDQAAGSDGNVGSDGAVGTDTSSGSDASVGSDSNTGADSGGCATSCTDSHRTVCVSDDQGTRCLCDAQYLDYGDGVCRPVDPCAASPCTELHRTVCVAQLGVARCYCDEGYGDLGTGSCQPTVSCTPNPCAEPNKHQCAVVSGHTQCSCDSDYVDDGAGLCVPSSGDPCSPNPCAVPNRTVCTPVNSQPVCSCESSYEEDGLGGCVAVVAPPCPDTSCGTAITGRITQGGAGWPGVVVNLYQGNCPLGDFVRGAQSDAAGYYVLDGLSSTGSHYVRAASGADARWYNTLGGSVACLARSAVSVTSGATAHGIDIAYPAGGAVSGRVTAAGSGIGPGLLIQFHRQLCGGGTINSEVLTDANGDFTARGLPEGSYYVEACATCRAGFESYADRWWTSGGGNSACAVAAQVEVASRTLTPGVDFVLETPADIFGTITLGGSPVSGVLVHAYDGTCSSGHYVDGAFSASDGVFHLPNVPAGTVYLETRMRNQVSPRYADLWWSSGNGTFDCSAASASTVTSGASLGGRDFHLQRGGSVSGQVTESTLPVAGAYVWAHVTDCGRGDERAWYQAALTDGSGNYRIEALPAGSVLVYVSPQDTLPGVVGWYNGSTSVDDCAAATAVTVTDATETSGIDLAF